MNKKILTFLVISFGIPLMTVLVTKIITIPSVNFVLFGIQGAAPSIAALLTVYCYNSKQGMKRFLRKWYQSDKAKRVIIYSSIIAILVFGLGLLSKIIYLRITETEGEIYSRINSKQMIIVLWALIAEEMGWRGFLQEELKLKHRALIPLVIGFLWTIWHYHYYWIGRNEIPVLIFMVGCIGESYIYYYITKRLNGNIIPVSVWHFMGNLVITICAMNPGENGGSILLYGIYTSMISILGIVSFIKEFIGKKRWLTTAST